MRYSAIGLMLFLTGCVVAQKIEQTRADYNQSRAAYKACLAANPPAGCERERQAMDADAKAYNAARGSAVSVDDE